jgi:hypothetical protein
MPSTTQPPKIKLSRLRDIVWSTWDPIGLLAAGKSRNDEECLAFADEYDRYLIYAAGQLRSGAPVADVVDYLVQIETEHMGLGERPTSRERVQAVVAAIRDDDQLWTYPDG